MCITRFSQAILAFYLSELVDFTVTCDAGAEVRFSSGGFRTRSGGLTNLFLEQSPFDLLLCTGAPQHITLDAIGYPGLRESATNLMTVAVAITTNSSTQFSFTGRRSIPGIRRDYLANGVSGGFHQ